MSGSSYGDSSKRTEVYRSWDATDSYARDEVRRGHKAVVEEAREKIVRGEAKAPPKVDRNVAAITDDRYARNSITRPEAGTKRAVVILVDNSGSNRVIAEHMKNSSGYFMAFARTVDPDATVACVYFSDHVDGHRCLQYTDWVRPEEKGDKQLFNSLLKVAQANGGDVPEAIECALHEAAQIDFAHIPQKDRTLILITDSVAHGMGYEGEDDGCPHQQNWRTSMKEVRAAYGKFVLVGSGQDRDMADIQRKLFETKPGVSDEEEVARNFIDFSSIESSTHRNGMVGNVVLFVMARNTGKQGIPSFLAGLYAKWLANPIFGTRTDELARSRITDLARLYLPGVMTPKEIEAMLRDVFAD